MICPHENFILKKIYVTMNVYANVAHHIRIPNPARWEFF
jgi:hypothetical protein